MVKLEIRPFHDNARDCLEDMLVSIALWYGCGYELMFSESWGFHYTSKETQIITLGDTITPEKNLFHCLEIYHGLRRFIHQPQNNEQLLQMIIGELTQKHPTIIYFDSFWSPWDVDYKRVHYVHVCSITGYDPQDEVLYCTDPYYMKYMEIIPLENFFNGTVKEFYSFVFDPGLKQEMNWCQILQNAVERVKVSDTSLNAFQMMRNYAVMIDKHLDFELEFPQLEKLWRSPIYISINNIAKGRNQFAGVLQYLSNQFGIQDLRMLSQKFSQLAEDWNSVVSLFVKGAYSRKSVTIKNQIAEKLRQLADREECLTETIIECIEKIDQLPDNHDVPFDGSRQEIDNGWIPVKNIDYLDLSLYMNNQGFGNYDDPSCVADFTGLGECLLTDGICSQQEIIIDEMRFCFPQLGIGIDDNISCQGQFIPVPSIQYELIMFLGCAEWGSFSGKAIIYYENDYQDEILLQFSDWFSSQSLYGEKLAWVGFSTKKISMRLKEKRHLYAQYYKVINDRPMIGIRLPECTNIHIFSISLGY